MKICLVAFMLASGIALGESDPLLGNWEVESTQQSLRRFFTDSNSYYYYPLPTILVIEPSLDKRHQYFVHWLANWKPGKVQQAFTFWCDGNETHFRCVDRGIASKHSFKLEFLTPFSAEIQDVSVGFLQNSYGSNYSKIHTMVKGASQWLKLPSDLYTDISKHAQDEKQSVDEWVTKTLKALSDLMKLPGAKGRGATYIIDQSRNYYGDKK